LIAKINRKKPLENNQNFHEYLMTMSGEASVNSDKNCDFSTLIKKNVYMTNFIVMNLSWAAAYFSYYTIGFYVKYIPGDVFENVTISCLSEAASCLISGVIASFIGSKLTLFLCFMTGGIFGSALVFVSPANNKLILAFLLMTKFGVSSALS